MRRPYSRLGPVTRLAVAATSAAIAAALSPGHYRIVTSTACFVKAGDADTVTATVADDTFVPAGGTIDHYVPPEGTGAWIAAIRQSADGIISITRVYP